MRLTTGSHLHRLVAFYGLGLVLAFALVGGVSLWAFDRLLERDIEQFVKMDSEGLMEVYRSAGRAGLEAAIVERTRSPTNRGARYLVVGKDGRVQVGHEIGKRITLPRKNGWIRLPSDDANQRDDLLANVHGLNRSGWLVVAHATGEHARLRDLMVRLGALSFILLALLTMLLGWMLRRSIDRSLTASLDTVDRVASGHLHERVPELAGNDGFARLGRTLNRMLGRIQDLVGGIQSSTDAIAHDLRTPLMRLKARLASVDSNRIGALAQKEIDAAIVEVDQLVATFNSLLRLARIESGEASPTEIVALDQIVVDAVELWQALAESHGQRLHLTIAPVRIAGDRDLLFQMVSNLLDNAIKYAGRGSEISVVLENKGSEVVLMVSDRGPGIAADQRERVFDRFVRLEPHRGTAGSGLGLSVVRAIAIRHRADLRLESANPGLRVRLAFPGAAEPPRDP
jgi:signal transduction histidine kinase